MEESLALMLYGCKLAKDLERNLPNLVNQPHSLLKSCEEIIKEFTKIKWRLSQGQMNTIGQFQELQQISPEIQEWLRIGGTGSHQATGLVNAQAILGHRDMFHDHTDEYLEITKMNSSNLDQSIIGESSGRRDAESLRDSGIDGAIQPLSGSNRASSLQRQLRR